EEESHAAAARLGEGDVVGLVHFEVGTAHAELPAVAEVLGLGALQAVVGAADGDRQAGEGHDQVGDRGGDAAGLVLADNRDQGGAGELVVIAVGGGELDDVRLAGQGGGVEGGNGRAGAALGVGVDHGDGAGVIRWVVDDLAL